MPQPHRLHRLLHSYVNHGVCMVSYQRLHEFYILPYMKECALRPGLVDTHRCALGIRTQNKDEESRPPNGFKCNLCTIYRCLHRNNQTKRRDSQYSPWQFPASALENSETSNPHPITTCLNYSSYSLSDKKLVRWFIREPNRAITSILAV